MQTLALACHALKKRTHRVLFFWPMIDRFAKASRHPWDIWFNCVGIADAKKCK